MIGKGSLMVKYSKIGLSPSSKLELRLSEKLVRDCILGFFLVFSFLVIGVDDNALFGEFRVFDDDESDISLLCVSFGVMNIASSR